MFLLIFASNLISLLIGWDLLGFTSFFLVSYYGNSSSHSSALLTGLSNRLGDCFYFLIIAYCLTGTSFVSHASVVLIVLVAITKSAQLPFSSWLPAAIFAPTPVRALVHSSTLVTAGIYLLFRFGPLDLSLILEVGVMTSLAGGLAACLEKDIKKIIAYSTLSQLGILMSGLGLGSRSLTFNHLVSHAVIKALIFLCVGILIHTYYGSQEARSCARLPSSSALTRVSFTLRALGLAGLTFTSGYFTKEMILESGYCRYIRLIALFLFYISIGLTIAYLARLCLVFRNSEISTSSMVRSVGNSPILSLSILILVVTILYQAFEFKSTDKLSFFALLKIDKIILYLTIFLGLFLGFGLRGGVRYRLSVLSSLNVGVGGLAWVPSLLSKTLHLENVGLQSFAVGSSTLLVRKSLRSDVINVKSILLLILVFCLC